MVSSFNENDLINFLLYEYENNFDNYEKILEVEINIIVSSNNTIGENQEIIIHYVGDVYDAMKLSNNNPFSAVYDIGISNREHAMIFKLTFGAEIV